MCTIHRYNYTYKFNLSGKKTVFSPIIFIGTSEKFKGVTHGYLIKVFKKIYYETLN